MRIVIGAPGNGLALKDALKEHLHRDERVSAVTDLSEPDITYPQVSFRAAQAIVDGRADRGILVCGTGVGTAIAASKVRGVRAATAHDLVTVRGSVENYDAQILCMGQNVLGSGGPLARSTARPLQQLRREARRDRGLRSEPLSGHAPPDHHLLHARCMRGILNACRRFRFATCLRRPVALLRRKLQWRGARSAIICWWSCSGSLIALAAPSCWPESPNAGSATCLRQKMC